MADNGSNKCIQYFLAATLVFLLCYPLPCLSQGVAGNNPLRKCTDCNAKDSLGRKTGLWIEDEGYKEVYYKNGLKDGVYKSYYRINGKLEGLGEYRRGEPAGTWYYFDEQSRLTMIESKIQKNTTVKVKLNSGKMVMLRWRSYLVKYYPNGYVREEGLVVYEDDIEIDNLKIGVWKYYDESGKLVKTKKENGARGN